MTLDEAIAFALALPGAELSTSYGAPAVKANGNAFLGVSREGDTSFGLTMTADFSQTDRNGKTLTGTLTLKRPGKIRFQYQKGVPQLIVATARR
jgi:outer membrane lipoprotein-sorting protein